MTTIIRNFTTAVGLTFPNWGIKAKVKDMVSKGLYDQTLQLYKQELHLSGLFANTCILPSVIKACSLAQSHQHFGLQLHCVALKSGSDSDPVTSNSLISMYAKFSKLYLAYQELIASIISLCAQTGDVRLGKQIHALIIVDERFEPSVFVSTALLDVYSKCHNLLIAFRVFDRMEIKNEVSWTAMISGCIANHNYNMGIDYFRAMQKESVKPNRVTVMVVLLACAKLDCIKYGKAIHGYAYRHEFDSNHHLSAALIHMYCECTEALHYARIMFERSKIKDVVTWSSIITGYSRRGDHGEAMKLFGQMRREGIQPNPVTLLAIISAYTSLSSLNHGLGVHCYILKCGLDFDVFIGNALINMYAKCGCLAASHQIFKEMPAKDLVSCSTLISSYGLHGCGEEALQLFHEMQESGMEMDSITMLAVLSACNHTGLVEEGKSIFNKLMKNKKIQLSAEHYACYVDILGKAGKIEDACEVVSKMPMKPSTKMLSSLLSACKIHGRLEVAQVLAHKLIESEPENAANYTMLSMVYAEYGNWVDVEKMPTVALLQATVTLLLLASTVSTQASSFSIPLSGKKQRFGGFIPNAKKNNGNNHSKSKRSWWQRFFLDEDGNWFGLKDNDMIEEESDSSTDEELSENEKFEAWKRRAEAIVELREAQEDMRNEESRRWEDWIVDDHGNGSYSSWSQDWDSGTGEGKDDMLSDPSDLLPEKGLVESVRDLVLGREDNDILYEDRVFQYASLNSAKFLAVLIIIPWALDFVVHDYVLMPFLDRYVKTVPLAAQMLDVRRNQKLEMVKELKVEKARFRLEVEIGKSPPLSDEELWWEMRHKAVLIDSVTSSNKSENTIDNTPHMLTCTFIEVHDDRLELRDEWRLHNRRAFANIWSDMAFGISLFILLYFNQSQVALLKFTGYKIVNNMSDTGKAFLIILITDIFLGYHSESGWQTLLEIVVEHYGVDVDQSVITLFICLVPVVIDACVKLWLFKFLPRLSPKVSNIFQEMKRH
ncbi:hypothetical protein JRO89_XS04G0261700 [Xanthoceras sorbifolium]|uniref:Chloroplast envelope membrane protein n=1 Tax=Xanthoceras sorbifolium TaxID=99658 RepID=A0ABQ8I818_9ROSI|nr:hypothetical protein JRO89_XS04G0261700 [Xanthoceras sorbifolium]